MHFKTRFFNISDQCKQSSKYVNKRLNACLICEHKFSSKRDVFLHVQKKHLVNIGGNPNSNEFDEIDITGEEVEQNGIENQARMDQDGLSNVVISSGTSLQNQIDLINPRTTLNPKLVNPDMARYILSLDYKYLLLTCLIIISILYTHLFIKRSQQIFKFSYQHAFFMNNVSQRKRLFSTRKYI